MKTENRTEFCIHLGLELAWLSECKSNIVYNLLSNITIENNKT